jgi:hypothetical protein
MSCIECTDGFRIETARISTVQNTILFNVVSGNADAIRAHLENAKSFTFEGKTYAYKKVLCVRKIGDGAKVSLEV